MDHRDDGFAMFLFERAHQLHYLVARGHVEKRGRLVEEHKGCVLRQDHGDEGALPLAAGKLGYRALGKVCQPTRLKRPLHCFVIGSIHRREYPVMWVPTTGHQSPHAHGRCGVLLRQQA